MSTYDAYNLSLRDSTEFTVPTGDGSGVDNGYEIVTVRLDLSNYDGVTDKPMIFGPIYQENEQFIDIVGTNAVISSLFSVDQINSVLENGNLRIPVINNVVTIFSIFTGGNFITTGDVVHLGNGAFAITGPGSITYTAESVSEDDGNPIEHQD